MKLRYIGINPFIPKTYTDLAIKTRLFLWRIEKEMDGTFDKIYKLQFTDFGLRRVPQKEAFGVAAIGVPTIDISEFEHTPLKRIVKYLASWVQINSELYYKMLPDEYQHANIKELPIHILKSIFYVANQHDLDNLK